jgi:murein DD-endopeptidase MepM/ murein hydrolase activator NlpD
LFLQSLILGSSLSGCIHRQTDLEWASSTGAPVQTSGTTIRGKALKDLEIMVEPHGVRRWGYPMDDENVAGSPYGMRVHPIRGGKKLHRGQDIPCSRFEPIYAVAKGEVVISKRSKTAGKYVEIRHESSEEKDVRTTYMHMSIRRVRVGRKVRKGKKIGRCGSTGLSTGPHLHFEVEVDGKNVPPFSYVERSAQRN